MAKYKLKALSCFLGGKLRKKEESEVFDSTLFDKKEFDSLVANGYLVEIIDKKSKSDEEYKPIVNEPIKVKKQNG